MLLPQNQRVSDGSSFNAARIAIGLLVLESMLVFLETQLHVRGV